MDSIEQKILTCSTALNPDAHQIQRLRSLMPLVKDVPHLIDTAENEGLACLLYKNLQKSGLLETFDSKDSERLRSLYYRNVHFNLKLLNDLKEVLKRVNQEKIQVVILQGTVLVHQIYGDPGLRGLTDIDLWVLGESYSGLINILTDMGYIKDHLFHNIYKRGSTTFDIHTHLLWSDRIKSRSLLMNKNQDHIYREIKKIEIEGEKAFSLSPSDQVLHMSLHALKHNMNSLIWLVDLKLLFTKWKMPDWLKLLDRARDLGQEKTLSYILYLLQHLFHFYPPLEIQETLKKRKLHFLERKALRQRRERGFLPTWAPLVLFYSGKGLWKRFSLIFETWFPRPEILRQVFTDPPDLKVRQLYRMRIIQLLTKIRISLKGF